MAVRSIKANDRRELLDLHNDLQYGIQHLDECRDYDGACQRKLDNAVFILQKMFEFSPKLDEKGRRMYYSDWVFSEDVKDDC